MKALSNVIVLIVLIFFISSCSKDDTKPVVDPGVYISSHDTYDEILVDHKGRTLYFFTKDFSGNSLCEDGCLDVWPVFFSEKLIIGTGLVLDDFDFISRPDGKGQITYKDWPLYYYADDQKEGDVLGDGVHSQWFVAREDYTIFLADGQLVGEDGNMYTSDYVVGEEMVQLFVDDEGRTLYRWVNDTYMTNNFTSADLSNNGIWPVFESGILESVPSVLDKSDFNSIDVYGLSQMTYKGWPLYYYGNDMETRGNTKGVSVPAPGVWPIVNRSTVVAVDPLRAAAETYFNDNLEALITNTCVSCHTGHHSSGTSKYDVFDNAYANAENMYLRVAGLQGIQMPQGGPQLIQSDIDKFETFKNKL